MIPTVPAQAAGYMGKTGTCTWTYTGGVWTSDASGCASGCKCVDALWPTNAIAGSVKVSGANATITNDAGFRTQLARLHTDLTGAGHKGVTPDPTAAAAAGSTTFTVPCTS